MVEEVEPYIKPSGEKIRQLKVICPKCGKHFITRKDRLNDKRFPVKQCPDCSGNARKQYNAGDKIGVNQLTVVEEVEPHFSPSGSKFRRFKVICPKCGKNFITWMASLNQKKYPVKQCPDCAFKEQQEKAIEWGHNRINDLTGQKFGKLTVLYATDKRNNSRNVIWHCKCECGNEKDISSGDLQSGMTLSCGCLKSSKGEYLISSLLKENNIVFEQQKTFNDCTNPENTSLLRFDFYLPDYNCCIEYDGGQHFKSVDYWGGEEEFERRQLLDSIKDEYCENNGIKMVRIPYWDYNKIDIDYLLERIK